MQKYFWIDKYDEGRSNSLSFQKQSVSFKRLFD